MDGLSCKVGMIVKEDQQAIALKGPCQPGEKNALVFETECWWWQLMNTLGKNKIKIPNELKKTHNLLLTRAKYIHGLINYDSYMNWHWQQFWDYIFFLLGLPEIS